MNALVRLPDELPLSSADQEFRDSFRSWLEANVPVLPEPVGRVERYHHRRAWQRTLAENGWAGVTWPREFGGMDASPVQQFLYYEELGRVRAPEFPNRPGLILLGPTLMRHASRELQERYLPGMLTADEIWAQCFSEPDSGSDLAGLRTVGRVDGSHLRITGQKTWVTAGDIATHAVVLCRTGDPGARHRSLTLALIDLDQPGVEIRPILASDGQTPLSEIYFDGAVTPLDHAIGEVDKGWAAAMMMLEHERGDLTFTDHRSIMATLENLWASAQKAREGDHDAAWFEGFDRAVLALWTRAHQLRELNVSMMFMRSGGVPIGFWGSPVKVVWAQLFQQVHQLAVQAADFTEGLDSAELRDYLYSRMSTVYSGAVDVQRSVVAERLLGLPRAAGDRPVPTGPKTGERRA